MKTPPVLDAITDKVLSYNPDAPKGPLKVIAGAPDRPLTIGNIEIPCYVLEDETRVLSQGGFLRAIGRSRTPKAGTGGVDKPPFFLAANNLSPFISNELLVSTTPIPFQRAEGARAYGYRATLLPQVCEVYLKARNAGALVASQQHIAARAELLILGLATVGVIALVDEATGYQRVREERALATILEQWITKEHERWTQTFPFEFYQQICRLKNWPSILAVKRPAVIGRYTNDFVYDRLAPGVLEELQRVNPTLPAGGRRHRHHQWFTPEHGHPRLREHLAAVMALMRVSSNWNAFTKNLDIAYPKQSLSREFPFGAE